MTPEDARRNVVRGQYGAGMVARPARSRLIAKSQTSARTARPRPTSRCSSSIDNWRWAGVPFYLRTGKALTRPHDRDRDPVQARAARAVPRHAGRAPGAERARAAHPARRGHLAAVQRQGAGTGVADRRRRHGRSTTRTISTAAPSTGYETLIYDCMIGDAIAVPARRQRRGGLARGAARSSMPGPRPAARASPSTRPAAPDPRKPTRSSTATAAAGGRSIDVPSSAFRPIATGMRKSRSADRGAKSQDEKRLNARRRNSFCSCGLICVSHRNHISKRPQSSFNEFALVRSRRMPMRRLMGRSLPRGDPRLAKSSR